MRPPAPTLVAVEATVLTALVVVGVLSFWAMTAVLLGLLVTGYLLMWLHIDAVEADLARLTRGFRTAFGVWCETCPAHGPVDIIDDKVVLPEGWVMTVVGPVCPRCAPGVN